MKFRVCIWLASCALGMLAEVSRACDLCAIYSASNARGESSEGVLLTVAEQYIPFQTLQFEGNEISSPDPSYVDSSFTHIVPGYNFSARFGLSLNVPIVVHSFKRNYLRPVSPGIIVPATEEGTDSGLGDIALIARWTIFQETSMKKSILINLLGGIKFPTGSDDRLVEEAALAQAYDGLFPEGHIHDAVPTISGVHAHHLTLGSGSYDGIFGITVGSRWDRWYFNTEAQCYLRTEGDSSYEFGDELMISGGPGAYILLKDNCTLSLQANAVYDTAGRDKLYGQKISHTGMTAWYLGPQVGFTWGKHLSLQAGVDIPLDIENNGLQVVPDYQVHGSLSWNF